MKLLSVLDVAGRLGYSVNKIYKLMHQGALRYIDERPYRIFADSVDAFIQARTKGQEPPRKAPVGRPPKEQRRGPEPRREGLMELRWPEE